MNAKNLKFFKQWLICYAKNYDGDYNFYLNLLVEQYNNDGFTVFSLPSEYSVTGKEIDYIYTVINDYYRDKELVDVNSDFDHVKTTFYL